MTSLTKIESKGGRIIHWCFVFQQALKLIRKKMNCYCVVQCREWLAGCVMWKWILSCLIWYWYRDWEFVF